MSDLYPRIRTAIEGRLELARRATPGPWLADPEGAPDVSTADGRTLIVESLLDRGDTREHWPTATANAMHIAANHPAWVIRALEADLSRLEVHAPVRAPGRARPVCAYEWGDGDGWVIPWDECPEVSALASVYLEGAE